MRTCTVYVYGLADLSRKGTHYGVSEERAKEIVTDKAERKEFRFIVSDDATGKRIEHLCDTLTPLAKKTFKK